MSYTVIAGLNGWLKYRNIGMCTLRIHRSCARRDRKRQGSSWAEQVRLPYLRVANVQDGYLDLAEIATIEIAVTEVGRYLLQPGDVLMNEGGDFDKLGRGYIWRGEIAPCSHQNHVFAVRPRRVSPEWLNAIPGSAYAQFYFKTRSKQSTNLASISSTNLMELPVILPPAKRSGSDPPVPRTRNGEDRRADRRAAATYRPIKGEA